MRSQSSILLEEGGSSHSNYQLGAPKGDANCRQLNKSEYKTMHLKNYSVSDPFKFV